MCRGKNDLTYFFYLLNLHKGSFTKLVTVLGKTLPYGKYPTEPYQWLYRNYHSSCDQALPQNSVFLVK